jgi:hypothetical protein
MDRARGFLDTRPFHDRTRAPFDKSGGGTSGHIDKQRAMGRSHRAEAAHGQRHETQSHRLKNGNRHRAPQALSEFQIQRDGLRRSATPYEEDAEHREMPRGFERDHAANGGAAKIERPPILETLGVPGAVLGKGFKRMRFEPGRNFGRCEGGGLRRKHASVGA